MIAIESIDPAPLAEVLYLCAQSGGGTGVERLPIVRAIATGLPDGLSALVACSDLQGIVRGTDDAAELLGIAVAAELDALAAGGVIPALAGAGAVLAGDLYSAPEANKRGGRGDVEPVWRAFAKRFAFVAGVAGNHDDTEHVEGDNVYLLDGERARVGGLRIGGVGKVIGMRDRAGRRSESEQLALIDRAIGDGIDLLLLHEGPHGDTGDQRGNARIRARIDELGVPLAIFGHDHWDEPLARCATGQLLNVDARVIVLQRSSRS